MVTIKHGKNMDGTKNPTVEMAKSLIMATIGTTVKLQKKTAQNTLPVKRNAEMDMNAFPTL
jgi:hypothetical protein